MHNYVSRNGVTEQTFYYRQQPPQLRHLPWGFEVREEARRAAQRDAAVVWAVVICFAGLMAVYYL